MGGVSHWAKYQTGAAPTALYDPCGRGIRERDDTDSFCRVTGLASVMGSEDDHDDRANTLCLAGGLGLGIWLLVPMGFRQSDSHWVMAAA
jgi:hypothetical protein